MIMFFDFALNSLSSLSSITLHPAQLSNSLILICILWLLLAICTKSIWSEFQIKKNSKRLRTKLAKGPWTFPFVGHSLHVLLRNNYRLKYFEQLRQKYGEVFRLDITGRTGVCVCDPQDIEYILKTNFQNYQKSQIFHEVSEEFLGDGIFSVDGELWRMQRKSLSHMFTTRLLRGYISDILNKQCQTLCKVIQQNNQKFVNEFYDIQKEYQRFTLDSIGEIAFGMNINSLETGKSEFGNAFDYATAKSHARLVNPTWKLLRWFGLPPERKLKTCVKVVDQFTYQLINDYRAKKQNSEDEPKKFDVLSFFMQTLDDNGQCYTDKFVRDIILNILIAGRDTTSNALAWVTYLLASHPQVQEKLRAEVFEYFGGKTPLNNTNFDYTTVNKMTYIQYVINETLRLYPSVPWDIKYTVQDDVLPSGYFVPKGSIVSYLIWVVNRNPKVWGSNAGEFVPERWIGIQKEAHEFPTFNAGPRTCLGIHLANLEIKYVLSTLLLRNKIVLKPDQKITYGLSPTLPVRNGLFVRFEPLN
eukprot:TRINITY_DN3000_c0_g1_i2.p1 TRINITY_DN3000_c0_g1~~TRINITY_DN3000_c0_g1_i2.p1  ORF type:complete len:529 (+),score=20.02 TRINITY_DN3000_c0_g1_i2:49-1635(+)